MFITLYLFQVYWQIKVGESSKEKKTFISMFGFRQFRLKSTSRTFHRSMALIRNVKCYVDDFVAYSKSKEDHIGHLGTVVELIRKSRKVE